MKTADQPAVAFVGVGAIGLPMAACLAKGGRRVIAVDPFEAARQRARDAGLTAVATLEEAGDVATVVVMVATPAQLTELVEAALGAGAALQAAWVVMSTVGPEAITTLGKRLRAAGARVVDAPVTGGVGRASRGELTIFASGLPEDREVVRAELSLMGEVHAVGDELGQGQSVKVVNQHLCSVHIVVAAEALALAERLGLDPAQVLPLLESGAAGSWMLSDRGPRMLQGSDAEVLSRIDIFVKDSGLVAEAARSVGGRTPVLDAARARYLAASAAGLGACDDSRVIDTYSDSFDEEG